MEHFKQLYLGLPVETQWFIAVIALLTLWFHVSFTQRTINNGPTILTTVGIFATFVAIALGLSAFDPSKVSHPSWRH